MPEDKLKFYKNILIYIFVKRKIKTNYRFCLKSAHVQERKSLCHDVISQNCGIFCAKMSQEYRIEENAKKIIYTVFGKLKLLS